MTSNLRDALQSYSHLHSHIAAIFISTGREHLGQEIGCQGSRHVQLGRASRFVVYEVDEAVS